MKKKTLATASLLLALLMPLGVTPLAVYADEAQTEISAVSEGSEEKDKDNTNENTEEKDKDNTDESSEVKDKDNTDESSEGKDKDNTNEDTEEKDKDKTNEDTEKKDNSSTNENSEGKDNGSTNDGSEADALKAKEETVAPVLLDAADTGLDDTKTFSPDDGDILNRRTGEVYAYADFEKAVTEAKPEDELELGIGTYSLYGIKSDYTTKDKILTFIGQGPDKTLWRIGAKVYQGNGGEYDSDYSFQGSQSVTFKNMRLYVPYNENYLGFSHTNVTVVEDCIIDGRTAFWGYKSATFKNTTFNAPTNGWAGDYALWTYSSPVMTFDGCTFNGKGKIINVYTDFGAGKNDIIVNFNDCTVNANFSTTALLYKTALNINDSNMGKYKYILNITNANVTAARDSVTCSQVFGFGGKADTNNTGCTDVNLDGKLVFSAGKKLTHSYTDGEHDKAYNYTGDWSAWTRTEGDEHLLYRTRTRTKICKYCSYSETLPEERDEKREYLLHYDLNGGTPAEGVDYSDHYYFDDNTATVADNPSRAGYQFAGWQDKDGNQYAAGNTVIVDHDITLTAQWNKLVTVSFDLCGHGGANIPSQTFVSGNKASEPTAPKEDGWVFGGWYTEKGCQYRFSFDSAVTSDITLYAKWDRVTTVVSTPVATPAPSPAPVATPTPTPSPAPAAAATKTATVKNAAIPQTSDVFPMEGLLALLAVGAVGFGAAGWLRKKHH